MDASWPYGNIDLAAANEANFGTFLALQEGMDGAEVRRDDGATWVANASPMFWFNMVTGLRRSGAALDAFIAEVKATHMRLGTPVMAWLSPTAGHAAEALTAAGIGPAGETPAMAARLDRLVAPEPGAGVTVERVADERVLREFARTIVHGTGVPEYEDAWFAFFQRLGLAPDAPVQNVLARVDGAPAAGATVSMSDDVAGLYGVATLAAYRRRGLGALVSKAALDLARDRDYTVGILQSSNLGLGVYRKMGFEETFRYQIHHWSPAD